METEVPQGNNARATGNFDLMSVFRNMPSWRIFDRQATRKSDSSEKK